MGHCSTVIREVRLVLEGETGHGLLQMYVLIEAHGDCPIGVQGWRHKSFSETTKLTDALYQAFGSPGDYLLWPLDRPGAASGVPW